MSAYSAMNADEYGVFKGTPQMEPLRLGIVRGRQRAIELMNRMYARLPGDYFLRDIATNEVVDSLQSEPVRTSRTSVCPISVATRMEQISRPAPFYQVEAAADDDRELVKYLESLHGKTKT
jgi:hypothetical protein